MFPKKKRITKVLFQIIMKQGVTLSGSLFVFRYIPQKTPQYAFVAPKSVAKKAIDRNKLRRQGYNALRSYSLKNGAGIFFYKKGAKTASLKEINLNIEAILTKTKLLV